MLLCHMRRSALALAALLVASAAGAALPTLHSEQPVSPVVAGPASNGGFVRSATDGTNFLIADYRDETLFATHLSPAGEHLDSPSIVVARLTGLKSTDERMDVIYVGFQYVIA